MSEHNIPSGKSSRMLGGKRKAFRHYPKFLSLTQKNRHQTCLFQENLAEEKWAHSNVRFAEKSSTVKKS
jgi:hypothetical protein